jgi:hypothetical protein
MDDSVANMHTNPMATNPMCSNSASEKNLAQNSADLASVPTIHGEFNLGAEHIEDLVTNSVAGAAPNSHADSLPCTRLQQPSPGRHAAPDPKGDSPAPGHARLFRRTTRCTDRFSASGVEEYGCTGVLRRPPRCTSMCYSRIVCGVWIRYGAILFRVCFGSRKLRDFCYFT